RPIWLQLTVALDNWAIMRARLTGWPGKLDDQRWKRLVAVARTADPDEGRNQVRDALERGRSENLSDLVVSAKNGKLPLQTLTFLGEVLNSSPTPGAHDLAVAILRAAQRKYPEDFWINYRLAWALHHAQDRHLDKATRYEEAIRNYTVAVALRPRNARVRVFNADFRRG